MTRWSSSPSLPSIGSGWLLPPEVQIVAIVLAVLMLRRQAA
jgi:hypothetical protein